MPQYPNIPERIRRLYAADFMLRATCQFFLVEANRKFPHGSGVLFTSNEKYYILSNSHVFDPVKFPYVYFLLDSQHPAMIEGKRWLSRKKVDAIGVNDPFDIAIIQLTDDVWHMFLEQGMSFLTLDALKLSVQLVDKGSVLIAGYPATKFKLNPDNHKVVFNPLIANTLPSTKNYTSIGFPPDFHHAIKYNRRSFEEVSIEDRMKAPLPHGMSGSGLWITPPESAQSGLPMLIGILNEYFENRAIMMATRIELYLSIIQQRFDSSLPYQGVTVNISDN